MKGFPNQVADLLTLTKALRVMSELVDAGANARDDAIFGEALIRKGVLRTDRKGTPIEQYLTQQKAIAEKKNQSFRKRGQFLRQLFRLLALISDFGGVAMTPAGTRIAAIPDGPLDPTGLRFWRSAILDMTHDGGDGTSSHPYQVLLRLVAKRPGITRAFCALALEARDDSEAELERITGLSGLSEAAVIRQIGTTKSNWDNAKKILPHFAEQLGDVRKVGQNFHLAESPGATALPTAVALGSRPASIRSPRRPSAVNAQTIATARTEDEWDEVLDSINDPELNQEAMRERKRKLTDRFNRHQAVVKMAAGMLIQEGQSCLKTHSIASRDFVSNRYCLNSRA